MNLGKILIVEDEKSLSDALLKKFTREDFEVLVENNGEDGLAIALREKPDVILLDLNIPKLDGMSLLKNLRKDNLYGKSAKVIILTNSYDIEKVGDATSLGVFDYFIKADSSMSSILNKVKEKLKIK
ncbi:MAG: response regulator [Patescibacteria group bacterium]|nr:response regulator [Patescibacteria group bacterium]